LAIWGCQLDPALQKPLQSLEKTSSIQLTCRHACDRSNAAGSIL